MDAADQQRHTSTLAHASKVDSGREAGWEMREIVAASYASKQMPPGSPSAAALLPSTTLTPES